MTNIKTELVGKVENVEKTELIEMVNEYDFITDAEINKRIEELKAMTKEEYNTYLDNLIEEQKRVQTELREVRINSIKREIEMELKRRNLSAFKDVYTNFVPINEELNVVRQVDLIEKAVFKYLEGIE